MSTRLEIKVPGRKYTNAQGQEKTSWNRVGTAFINDDDGQGVSVSLEIDPGISVSGKLKCFVPLPRDGQQQRSGGQQQPASRGHDEDEAPF